MAWTLGSQVDEGEIGMGGAGGASGWTSYAHGYSAGFVTRGLADHSRGDVVYQAIEAALGAG